tara:strand:+ start:52 stop:549 length:498 start_codon:yes stop_codon:yes gene_type:complete
MAKKYSTVTITPTIVKADFADGDVMGDFTRLPLPVRDGESVMLKNISIVDVEDLGKDIDIIFVKNTSGDAELGTSDGAVDITDANLKTNVFLGHVTVDFSANTSDLIGSKVSTVKDVNLILTSSNQDSTDGVQTGCFFGIIAREATDTSAGANDHLTITFGFEIN